MASSDQPTRRDFLHGRVAAGLLGGVARLFADQPDLSTPILPTVSAATLLASFRRRAMACEFEVQVPAADSAKLSEPALAALDLLEVIEAQLTIYRADSEVLRINRQAAERPIQVESRLFALIKMAARLHQQTDGALDITSGPLSDAWGFSRRQGRMPSDEEIATALNHVGMDKVLLNDAEQTVAFQQPGVSLHLNCIGKGYALDRLAALLDAASAADYLLHGGRSSILARGTCPGSDRPGWTIGLPHPLRPGDRLGELRLVDESLGTSGSATQSFEHEGRRYGHLLDPRTGRPVTGVFTATAIAPSAAEADALSTAFYVMRPDEVGRFCDTRPDVAAILVCPGKSADDPRLVTFGLKDRLRGPLANS
jgi:thiamine biosynthesis lipoprotein